LAPQFARFLLVGVSNTALTLALFLILAIFVPLVVAYTVVFSLGVAYTTLLSRSFVFRSGAGPGQVLGFVAGYIVVYLVGRLVLRVLAATSDVPNWAAALAVVAVTAPLTFLLGRWSLRPVLVEADRDPEEE
jgi:putative flippase GtrA